MRGIGLFNIGYGGLGLLASLYLGRMDGVAVSLWTMGGGAALTAGLHRPLLRRAATLVPRRLRRTRGEDIS